MIAFVLMVCSSNAASLPTRPGFVCASADTLCWKEQVLWYDKQLMLATDIAALEHAKATSFEANEARLRKGYEDSSALAEKLGAQALKNAERSWTESPALWSSVTAVVVASLAIGIAQGFKISLNGR